MKLLPNDLLSYDYPTKRMIRILWISPQGNAFTIDVEDLLGLPQIASTADLIADIKQGCARLMNPDPYLVIAVDSQVTKKRTSRRESAWDIIKKLVVTEPDIYLPSDRAELVDKLVIDKVSTRVTIYKHLRRFWQRGMTKNALLPDYPNSGGRGQVRESKDGVKRGRPRKYGDQSGVNVTSDIRQIFQVSVDRFYATSERFTKKGAYDLMIRDFFCDQHVDPDTNLITHDPKDSYVELGFPTYDQYCYWLGLEANPLVIKRKRMGARRYDKDCRGLLGTSTTEAWGPGARYQIDATIADVFLVSRFNRNKIIGRPVLYIVIDVFSRMIVGLYIGLEGPSWVGAMMALANTAADKVKYCLQLGRVIEHEEWPCHHLPAVVLGDRGEIESEKIETLINNFNVIVEVAQAYRADWKGVVERRFRLLPAEFKPYVPGYIDVDYRARGGKDYRLDARLNLDEFAQIIIECALYFNNFHEISSYDKDRDVAADGVPAIPVDLWGWGMQNSSGRMRSFPEDQVRFSLMPVDDASVTVFGLYFRGSYYTCARAMEERWFDRARQQKRWKVRISYDPRTVDQIYLHDASDPRKYQVCTLTDRSRAHQNLSLCEVEQQISSDKDGTANRKQGQQLAKSDLSANIERIVDKAVKEGDATNASAASKTRDIRPNRADEKQANRVAETFRLEGARPTSAHTAQVVQLPGTSRADLDYSEPDITELLGAEETDHE